jgi:hypothetical protein
MPSDQNIHFLRLVGAVRREVRVIKKYIGSKGITSGRFMSANTTPAVQQLPHRWLIDFSSPF